MKTKLKGKKDIVIEISENNQIILNSNISQKMQKPCQNVFFKNPQRIYKINTKYLKLYMIKKHFKMF